MRRDPWLLGANEGRSLAGVDLAELGIPDGDTAPRGHLARMAQATGSGQGRSRPTGPATSSSTCSTWWASCRAWPSEPGRATVPTRAQSKLAAAPGLGRQMGARTDPLIPEGQAMDVDDSPKTLSDLLREHAATRPSHPAIVQGERRLSWGDWVR